MLYGNSSTGYSYSPDRSKDVDRFNPSTKANYSTSFASASGSYSTGYYYSPARQEQKKFPAWDLLNR